MHDIDFLLISCRGGGDNTENSDEVEPEMHGRKCRETS